MIEQPQNKISRKVTIIFSVVFVLVLIVAVCEAFFLHSVNTKLVNTNESLIDTQQQLQTLQNNFSAEAALEGKDLISKVGELTALPTSEQPTIATVADLSKLQGQIFFANAQTGDKILMYTNANKIILYRPSTDKIINTAALDTMNK
jgi:predicted PurR-regulated permease PerM